MFRYFGSRYFDAFLLLASTLKGVFAVIYFCNVNVHVVEMIKLNFSRNEIILSFPFSPSFVSSS